MGDGYVSDFFVRIGLTDYNASEYTMPAEKAFRDAWEVVDGGPITINLEKAKDIWRDKIRRDRASFLEDLDTQYIRALERGEDVSEIVAQKQALRDAPALPSIDAVTEPEQLKLIQPIPNFIIEY